MRYLRLGITSLLAAATQGLGMLQLLLLLLPSGAARASDSYVFIASWSQAPSQVLLLGVLYPIWLRSERSGALAARYLIALVPLLSIVTTVFSGFLFSQLSGTYASLALHTTLFALLAVFTAVTWSMALKLMSEGSPNWMAGATLASNIISCALLSANLAGSVESRVTLMLAGQLAGMIIYLAAIIFRNRGLLTRMFNAPGSESTSEAQPGTSGGGWFFTQSVSGYGANLVLQTQTATLPANALSLVGLLGRILGGMNSVVTNSIIPRIFHNQSMSAARVHQYVQLMLGVCAAAGAAVAVGLLMSGAQPLALALVCIAWFASSTVNSSMKRVAVRFLPPKFALYSTLVHVSIPIVAVLLGLLGGMSLVVVLLLYVAMDFLPGVIIAFRLGRFWTGISAVAVVGTEVAIACLYLN